MKNEKLYTRTVDILVQAYLNDTLRHGNCYACAVGNIIAANKGYTYVPATDQKSQKITWNVTGGTYYNEAKYGSWFDIIHGCGSGEKGVSEISSTGYSINEIRKIERAFERAEEGESSDEYMFNGLMAVLNVLEEIHEVDATVTTAQKNRFTKLQTA